jgi:hypothetical protein
MQTFKIYPVIVSSQPGSWSDKELAFLRRVMRQMEDVEVAPIKVLSENNIRLWGEPEIYRSNKDGKARILGSWFRENISAKVREIIPEANAIVWHTTNAERNKYGVTDFVGLYWRDGDRQMDLWIAADEGQRTQKGKTAYAYDPKFRRKIELTEKQRLFFHEMGHAVTHFSGRRTELALKHGIDEKYEDLITHYFDYELRDVTRVYREVSFKEWSMMVYIVSLLKQLVGLLVLKKQQKVSDINSAPKLYSQLTMWAKAIKEFEDYVPAGGKFRDNSIAPQGSLSWRNKNPGNLRWSPYEIDNTGGFSVFKTYDDGWKALLHQLTIAADGRSGVYRPDMTLKEFFHVYAPSSDNNYPDIYAQYVADRIGVPVTTLIKTLI